MILPNLNSALTWRSSMVLMQLARKVLSLRLSVLTRRPVSKLHLPVLLLPLLKSQLTLNPARTKTASWLSFVLPYVRLKCPESVRVVRLRNLQTLVALKQLTLELRVMVMACVVLVVLNVLTCTIFSVICDVTTLDRLTLRAPTALYPRHCELVNGYRLFCRWVVTLTVVVHAIPLSEAYPKVICR